MKLGFAETHFGFCELAKPANSLETLRKISNKERMSFAGRIGAFVRAFGVKEELIASFFSVSSSLSLSVFHQSSLRLKSETLRFPSGVIRTAAVAVQSKTLCDFQEKGENARAITRTRA